MKWSGIGLFGALAVFVVSGTAWAQAAQFSTTRLAGKVTLTAIVGDVRFVELLTSSTFDLTIASCRDRVSVNGNENGDVQIERGGRALGLRLAAAGLEELAAVRAMLTNSPAVLGLDDVARRAVSEWSRYAPLVQAASSFVSLLQGRGAPTARPALNPVATRTGFVLAAAQDRAGSSPANCWDTYTRSVVRYANELEACVREARDLWWEVWRPGLCGAEYDLRVTLAFYWLLDCHGW